VGRSAGEAAPAQDDVDERPAGASVAVGEGVDRLELRMGDRRLHECGMVVAVDVLEEVVQQGVEGLRWGWDEGCRAGVVAAAADPVLHCADDSADLRYRGSFHQDPVDVEEVVECNRARRRAQLDCGLHRSDVGEDLDGDLIGGVAALGEHDLGIEQSARPGLQALDLRGGDRLGAQHEPCQPFQADMRCCGCVQPPDGGFGIAEVGDEVGRKFEIPTGEPIGEVSVVIAAPTVAAAHSVERGGPAVPDQRRHNRYPFCS